jgi:hypothetical protein
VSGSVASSPSVTSTYGGVSSPSKGVNGLSFSALDSSREVARFSLPGDMSIIGTSSDAATGSPALGVIGRATGSDPKASVGVDARVESPDVCDSVVSKLMVRGVYPAVSASDMTVSWSCDPDSGSALVAKNLAAYSVGRKR